MQQKDRQIVDAIRKLLEQKTAKQLSRGARFMQTIGTTQLLLHMKVRVRRANKRGEQIKGDTAHCSPFELRPLSSLPEVLNAESHRRLNSSLVSIRCNNA